MNHDTAYEQCVLMHMNPFLPIDLIDKQLVKQLDDLDFHDKHCRSLFKAFKYCIEKTQSVNASVIEEWCQKNNKAISNYIWYEEMLKWILIAAPHQCVERLKELRARREAINFKVDTYSSDDPVKQITDKSKSISNIKIPKRITTESIIEKIKKGVETTATGFEKLDMLCNGGIESGGVMVLAGMPGTGKTAYAINIASNLVSEGKSVYFCSLEMPEDRILTRFLQCFWGNTQKEVIKHVDDMKDLPGSLAIDCPGSNIQNILNSMLSNLDCDMFIIDFFTLITSDSKSSKVEKLEDICHTIKNFALENKKPVVLLAQPNRELLRDRTNREPQLSDLAWCSALEQDAHIVSFLWDKNAKSDNTDKVSQYLETGNSTQDKDLKIVVRKNRNGLTGIIDVDFDGSKMKFIEKNND